jgi:hypothetical protein
MTGPIQQLYCTHCTYGTSALHRHTGAIQNQVFEYSTRAGSVPQPQSHEVFQKIESLLYFHLPGDTPGAEWLNYHAGNTPWQRMLYFPAINGQQLFTRICYRTTDTRGRPGSYFAHVLLSEAAAPAITALDALRMWGAADFWVSADRAEFDFELKPLSRLSEQPGYEGSVRDEVLWSFLTTAPGGEFCDHPAGDPRSVIPARWRQTPVEVRQTLVRNLVHGALELDFARQERMVVAVEPALAALLFYGLLRLLPPRGVADQLSFSTFESHLDRPLAMLTASAFFRPEAAELLPEIYRGRGYVQNTWQRHPPRKFQNEKAGYPARAMSALLQQGWKALDELRGDLAGSKAATSADYEDALRAAEEVEQLVALDPKVLRHYSLPEAASSRRYAQRILAKRLAAASRDVWRAIAMNSGVYLHVLDLVGSDPRLTGAEAATAGLLRALPTEPKIRNRFLELPGLAVVYKQRWLKAFFNHYRKLPLDLPALWSADMLQPEGALAGVVEQLSSAELLELGSHVPANRLGEFVGLIARACEQDATKREALTQLAQHLGNDAVAALLAYHSAAVLSHLPPPQSALASRLQELLKKLTQQPPDRLLIHLTGLNRGLPYLPEDSRKRVRAWSGVKSRLEALVTAPPEARKSMFGGRDESHATARDPLVEELQTACGLPRGVPWPAEVLNCLKQFCLRAGEAEGSAVWGRARKVLLPGQIADLQDEEFVQFLNHPGFKEWRSNYPTEDELLSHKVLTLLDSLLGAPVDIAPRVEAIYATCSVVPQYKTEIVAWHELMTRISELKSQCDECGAEQLRGPAVAKLAEQIGESMAKAFVRRLGKADPETCMDMIHVIGCCFFGDETMRKTKVVNNIITSTFRMNYGS